MPITFEDILAATKTLDVEFAGQKVKFNYAPGAWSSAKEREWNRERLRLRRLSQGFSDEKPDDLGADEWGTQQESQLDEISNKSEKIQDDFLVEHIVSWEITGKDGKPLPVTMETLKKFPIAFRNALFNAIEDDRNPTRQRKS